MKGKAYANRKPEPKRPKGDFYETPSCMVQELLNTGLFYGPLFTGLPCKEARIYDPCCGNYAIGNVLRKNGYKNIKENDIIYGNDFLKENDEREYDIIIMNPPFKLFDEFVKKAKKKAWKVYCIGKMNFFGAHNRNVNELWKGLEWVLPFDRMIAFDKPEINGKVECGMIVSCFMIWDCEYGGYPKIKVIDVQKYIRPSTKRNYKE